MAFMHTSVSPSNETCSNHNFLEASLFQSQGEPKERKPFSSLMENVFNVFNVFLLTSATEVSRSEAWAQCM